MSNVNRKVTLQVVTLCNMSMNVKCFFFALFLFLIVFLLFFHKYNCQLLETSTDYLHTLGYCFSTLASRLHSVFQQHVNRSEVSV